MIRLDVGEPDFDTPEHIIDAAARAMRNGTTRYVAPEGLLPLRAAVAAHVRQRGCDAMPERVVISAGAKPMVCYALLALLQPGDEVLVPDPGYPGYHEAVRLASGTVVPYPVTDAGGAFRIDVSAIEESITSRTRVLVLNSPHNPTGGVCTDAELDAIAALALRHDLHVVSDEVYGAITFDAAPPTSIASRPGMGDRTVVVDSFSKTYAMTGWRLGFAHLPMPLVERVRALLLNTATCTPAFVQEAGLAALTGPQDAVREMVQLYRHHRDTMVAALRGMPGVSVQAPAGAFYVFPRVQASGDSSAAMAARLREEHLVACNAGGTYGRRGEGHLRLSFATSEGLVREATARLLAFILSRGSAAAC